MAKNQESKLKSIIEELLQGSVKDRTAFNAFKRRMAKKYGISCPSNVNLLSVYHQMRKNKSVKRSKHIELLLQKRPMRSLSGIINVSVLTKPYPCPGECIFCPQEKGLPKSYLKKEPAVQRALLVNFQPCKQTTMRLRALRQTGHPTDKVELRIIGGTWSYYPRQYQTWFVKECFKAANQFKSNNKPLPSSRNAKNYKEGTNSQELKREQTKNETAQCRIVGITVETRPDYINIGELKQMRDMGITRVELGVQSIYNKVLDQNKRGHNVETTIKATQLLKQAGFKVSYQMMLNLPGSSPEKDVKMFEDLFSKPDFCPDLLKIYPLALVKSAPLFYKYKWYQQGKYKPYTEKQLTDILLKIKLRVPYWCRIQRIIRDIPAEDIVEGGAKTSNLREVVQEKLKQQGKKCRCLRCREVRNDYNPKDKLNLFRYDYEASEGKEIFLSFETENREKLYAVLRLRINHGAPWGFLKNRAIIREVHTYGLLTPLGKETKSAQHKGLGKKLINEAEGIAKHSFGIKSIWVISAIGTREYYRKLGYCLEHTYMKKKI